MSVVEVLIVAVGVIVLAAGVARPALGVMLLAGLEVTRASLVVEELHGVPSFIVPYALLLFVVGLVRRPRDEPFGPEVMVPVVVLACYGVVLLSGVLTRPVRRSCGPVCRHTPRSSRWSPPSLCSCAHLRCCGPRCGEPCSPARSWGPSMCGSTSRERSTRHGGDLPDRSSAWSTVSRAIGSADRWPVRTRSRRRWSWCSRLLGSGRGTSRGDGCGWPRPRPQRSAR